MDIQHILTLLDLNDPCCATQSKTNPIRCKNKRRDNSIFCGVHKNVDNSRIFNIIKENSNNVTNVTNNELETNNERPIILTEEMLKNCVLSNDTNHLSVTILRNFIKDHNHLKNVIDSKKSRTQMLEDLHHYFSNQNNLLNNDSYIVKIQRAYRRWSIYRRNVCSNKTDILTMDTIFEIPPKFFYIFVDKTKNQKFGYDIRTLLKILYDPLNPKYIAKCPYTSRPFSNEEILLIELYIQKLQKSGISLEIERPKLSKEKEIELKCVDIFLRIDLLDNYTQSKWFMDLDVKGLLKFYANAKDIWNYRLGMTPAAKQRILQSSIHAFDLDIEYLKKLPSKIALQNMILREIDRFISEGINREERKLGAMLMLTALVETSAQAAQGLPHLVQIY